jgi:hypothetical protein
LWIKSPNGQADKAAFAALYQKGFLISTPKNMPNATHTFWMCFEQALANNKKGPDGKQRILSIIANEFTYEELKQNLNVSIFLMYVYCYLLIFSNFNNNYTGWSTYHSRILQTCT